MTRELLTDVRYTSAELRDPYPRLATWVSYRFYDSFPSVNSPGWPEAQFMSNLTRRRFSEWCHWTTSPGFNGSGLYLNTVPDQYLEPTSAEETEFRYIAMNRAIEAFMDNKVNMAATFAERQSTIDMVGKRCYQAYNVLKQLRKGNIEKSIKLLTNKEPKSKTSAGLELEWAYGWAPLVGDIYTLCDKEFPPDPEVYISKSYKRPWRKTATYGSIRLETDGVISGNCAFIARMNSPLVASANSLGLINPATVAWEVVPFSFVVDWFLPVGDYIDSLNAFSGYKIIDKSATNKKHLIMKASAPNGATREKHLKTINRSVHIDISRTLRFKNPISVAHAVNALSLIRVLRKD